MTGALSRVFPIATVVAAIMVVWYGFTVYLNSPWQIEQYEKAGIEWQMEDLVREWDRPYSREQGCFPPGAFRVDKYWPPVNRVDNAWGDRNLVCICPPMEDYADAAE